MNSNTLTRRIAAQLGGKWRAYYHEQNTQRKDRIGREITALNSKLEYEKTRIAARQSESEVQP